MAGSEKKDRTFSFASISGGTSTYGGAFEGLIQTIGQRAEESRVYASSLPRHHVGEMVGRVPQPKNWVGLDHIGLADEVRNFCQALYIRNAALN